MSFTVRILGDLWKITTHMLSRVELSSSLSDDNLTRCNELICAHMRLVGLLSDRLVPRANL
jgi:hypothetical protein